MRTKVTEQGVVIPKELLVGVEEVEIRQEDNLIIVVPTTSRGDPLLELGKDPVACGAPDASENHDKYLYRSHS